MLSSKNNNSLLIMPKTNYYKIKFGKQMLLENLADCFRKKYQAFMWGLFYQFKEHQKKESFNKKTRKVLLKLFYPQHFIWLVIN